MRMAVKSLLMFPSFSFFSVSQEDVKIFRFRVKSFSILISPPKNLCHLNPLTSHAPAPSPSFVQQFQMTAWNYCYYYFPLWESFLLPLNNLSKISASFTLNALKRKSSRDSIEKLDDAFTNFNCLFLFALEQDDGKALTNISIKNNYN